MLRHEDYKFEAILGSKMQAYKNKSSNPNTQETEVGRSLMRSVWSTKKVSGTQGSTGKFCRECPPQYILIYNKYISININENTFNPISQSSSKYKLKRHSKTCTNRKQLKLRCACMATHVCIHVCS